MKKTFLSILLVTLISMGVQAQTSFFSINYSPGFLAGDAADFISNASWRGWGLEGRYFVSDQLSIGANVGFNGFYEKTPRTTYVSDDQNIAVNAITWRYIYNIPIYVNAHYYFSDYGLRPYIGVGIGTMYTSQEIQFSAISIQEKKWAFAFAPEVGFLVPLGDESWGMVVSGKYNYSLYNEFDSNAMQYINLNVGFVFNSF